MTITDPCPRCGTSIPPDAPSGLCPNCLLAGAFAGGENLSSDGQFEGRNVDPALARTTPATDVPAFVAPSVSELTPLFPQLELQQLIGQGGMGAVLSSSANQTGSAGRAENHSARIRPQSCVCRTLQS